ncbi:hypothetical protein LTR12_016930 [Friedmanniomyces endolithicus]|nr:hypothetical protein LTR12_016930 [Friedmanniomyces endolithicus]
MATHKGKRTVDDGDGLEAGGRKKSRSAIVPAVSAVMSRMTRQRKIDITNGPRQAVFMTTELLEDILIHASSRELFVLQRVCRRFREVVAGSAKLQEKMFLRLPTLGLSEKWTMFRVESSNSRPRLKLTRLQINGSRPATAVLNYENQSCLYGAATMRNPYFSNQVAYHHQFARPQYPIFDRLTHYDYNGTVFVLLGSASWGGMYLTDQPCKTANVYLLWSIETKPQITGRIDGHVTTETPDGFTVGSLLDAILRMEMHSQVYYDGTAGIRISKTSPAKLLARLEKKTKKKATVSFLQIDMYDVLFTSGWAHATEEHA